LVGIDIETCPACGRTMRIIACSEDPAIIDQILSHLKANAAELDATRRPPVRAPPPRGLFDETGYLHESRAWTVASVARQWRRLATWLDTLSTTPSLTGIRALQGILSTLHYSARGRSGTPRIAGLPPIK
jgi:hypothetical protein